MTPSKNKNYMLDYVLKFFFKDQKVFFGVTLYMILFRIFSFDDEFKQIPQVRKIIL